MRSEWGVVGLIFTMSVSYDFTINDFSVVVIVFN